MSKQFNFTKTFEADFWKKESPRLENRRYENRPAKKNLALQNPVIGPEERNPGERNRGRQLPANKYPGREDWTIGRLAELKDVDKQRPDSSIPTGAFSSGHFSGNYLSTNSSTHSSNTSSLARGNQALTTKLSNPASGLHQTGLADLGQQEDANTSIYSQQSSFNQGLAVRNNAPQSNPPPGFHAFSNTFSSGSNGLPKIKPELRAALSQLCQLIANITDSYTSAIFLAAPYPLAVPRATASESSSRFLFLAAVHTLSRELLLDAKINFGSSLLGWTAENGVRISVCPFEHDSRTLLYYSTDQALKSFVAIPIVDPQTADSQAPKVLGVIACDSKKTYAFAKVTEKILQDCAQQAAALIKLCSSTTQSETELDTQEEPSESFLLNAFIEQLRNQKSERDLLEALASLPPSLAARDALVVITTEDPLSPASAFYSPHNHLKVGHRLLEHVCRHKKVICKDRSVQAKEETDSEKRSFLSIPFHISTREAGSINLLSEAHSCFSAKDISTLEKIAGVIGKELELHRLRQKFTSAEENSGLLSWEQFSKSSAQLIPAFSAAGRGQTVSATGFGKDAASNRAPITLTRICLQEIVKLEQVLGAELCQLAFHKLLRLIEQAKGSNALACLIYGHQALILSSKHESERIAGRLKRLIERISQDPQSLFEKSSGDLANPNKGLLGKRSPSLSKVSEALSQMFQLVQAHSPDDGLTLDNLLEKSNSYLALSKETLRKENSSVEKQASKNTREVLASASNW